MLSKACFKCGEDKPLSAFYRHKGMADGFLGKCKECTKIDVKSNRDKDIDRIRAYDRARGSRQTSEYSKEYRLKFPLKYKAHVMIGNALRDGKIFKEPCQLCGTIENIHAHHDDYAKPLNVRWLCTVHHKQWHSENGPGMNG